MKVRVILMACLISFLTACESQRAITRGIYCDDVLLGETLVPEGGWGFGPYTLDGGMKMQFDDIDTGLITIIDISACKKVEIREEISGIWRRR